MVLFSLNNPILKLPICHLRLGFISARPAATVAWDIQSSSWLFWRRFFAGNLDFYVPPLQALCCRFDPIHENHFRLILCVRVLARAVEGNENCIFRKIFSYDSSYYDDDDDDDADAGAGAGAGAGGGGGGGMVMKYHHPIFIHVR